jgi:signal transduction histidine kinase/DNA-binding response OmpR family regulator
MDLQQKRHDNSGADFLVGGGEMGQRMRDKDWSGSVFGPVEEWPGSLKTSISMMLPSRFAMVIAWGPDFRFFYNDRYRPVLGATKHPGALGTPAQQIFPEAWPFIGPLFESTRAGESVALDDVLIPLERYGYLENCYFTLSYSPIRDESGGVGGMLAVVAETTERVQAERRLKTLRDLARRAADDRSPEQALVNAAASLSENPIDVPFALFYLVNEQGTIAIRVATTGIAAVDVAAPVAIDLATAGNSGWPIAGILEQRHVRVVDDLPQRFGSLPGGPYPEPAHTAVIAPLARPGQPRPDGFVIFGVSPRRALDDSYRGFYDLAADHILTGVRNAVAYREERKRLEALAEIDRAKTAFFSNVSHEFRTPLTLMLGPLEDLLAPHSTLSRQAREQLDIAYRNSLRLLKLVNTVLDFSRIEADRVDANYEPVELGRFTAELASVFRSTMEKAGLRFQVDCSPLSEPVYIDRGMWEKIVFNLLSNAFKFTFEGGIAIRLREVEGKAQLVVEDTGAGIPVEELTHLWERFHRVKGAKGRTYEGTGIGLALVQELVRLHGGTVSVISEVGRGSTFFINVPLGRGHLPAERTRDPQAPSSAAVLGNAYVEEALRWLQSQPAVTGAAQPAREPTPLILLADDNSDMRGYVERLLTERFRVIAVPDGEAALAAVRRERPDLIISDVMMPRLDGLGLLKELRSSPGLNTIPVILLSARAGEEAHLDGLAAGADDYMIKPFSARELLARVNTHLEMTKLRRQVELTVRQSEERERLRAAELETLMAAVPAAVFIGHDLEGRVITGSQAAYEMLRLPPGANLSLSAPAGERPLHFKVFRDGAELTPDDLPVQAAGRGIELRDVEEEIVFDDGSSICIFGSAVPLHDANQQVRGSIAAFVDITARKRAEQRLSMQYDVSRILAETSALPEALAQVLHVVGESLGWDTGGVWLMNAQQNELSCVHLWHGPSISVPEFAAASQGIAMRRGVGLPGRVWESLSPSIIDDVTSDGNFPRLQAAIHVGLRSGLAFPIIVRGALVGVIEFFSLRRRRPDDELMRTLTAVGHQVGQFIDRKQMEGERLDLLEREKSARQQLEVEREILETVNRSGQMLSGELDLQRLVQSLTDAATDITGAQFGSFFYNVLDERGASYMLYTLSGVSPEHFTHFPMPRSTDLFGPTFRGEGTVRIDEVKRDPRYGKNSPYYGMPKGHLPVTSYLAVPVMSRSGDVLGGLFFGHSRPAAFSARHERIVEGLAGQAAIAIDNARLFEAAHKAKIEAETANRLKDEFLATVSHELRTPLNAMLGWTRLLRAGKLDEAKQRQALETVERNAVAQQQIIEDILDVSRIITGKLRLEVSPVDLGAIVSEAADSIRPSAEAKGVRLQSISDSAASLVLGDANRLQQIVWNLLSNAVKFTPRAGRVQVVLERINSYVEITVRDTGKGISREFLPFVFERFRQADSSTTRQFGGLGLGLAIVRHLTELHGGTVQAASPGEGQGATFTVRFPLAIIHGTAELAKAGGLPLRPPDDAPAAADYGFSLEGVKVLAVDDEADARELMTVVLTQCRASVKAVSSVREALEVLEQWKPDVLISDIGMPSDDGYSLIRKIRALPKDRGGSLPAAALTAYARSDDRVRALAAGYQTHVSKPVEPSELVAVIASLAGRTPGSRPPA